MTDPDLARRFAHFARSGDPNALAQVFDAVAPRLLLVACHLTRDRAAAEDLVQTTFVAAIEDAAQFDPARPLLPWLCGILARRARSTARAERRALDPARLRPANAHDPAHEAERRDTAQQVLTAIDGLPERYRHVLVLHLVHDLQATQIAHALGRSPQTVRTQLRRGLQLLRGALPSGLLIPAALLATEGRGLASVRTAVVEHANTLTATTPASTTAVGLGGLLLMKTATLVTLAAAGLATLALAWPNANAPAPAAAAHAGSPMADAVLGRTAPDASGTETSPTRVAVAVPTTDRAPAIMFVGRCVDATTTRPLADCTVTVHGEGALVFQRLQLDRATTGVDGAFVLHVGAEHGKTLTVSATAADRTTTTAIWRDVTPGTIELGDVPMHSGARCRGRVVDEHDAPVAGVDLFAMVADVRFAGHNRHSRQLVATSAGDGSFVFRDDPVLPPGSWELETTAETTIVRPRHLVVAPHDRVLTPTIVVRTKPADARLAGVVRDPRGAPLAHVHVDLQPFSAGTETDADGRFALFRPDDAADEVELVLDGGGDHVSQRAGPFAWGRQDLAFELQPAARPRLLVVDATTGAPIVHYSLATRWSDDVSGGVQGPNTYPSDHDGGLAELARVGASGTLAAVVLPDDPLYAPATLAIFEPRPQTTQRVAVARRQPVRVRLSTAGGAPAAGSSVEIVHPERPGTTTISTSVVPVRAAVNSLGAGGWRASYAIDRGTTDADGRVTLHAAPEPLALRVSGPTHAPLVLDPLTLPAGDGELRLEVAPGAMLTGRCKPAPDPAQWARDAALPSPQRRLGLVLRRPGELAPALPPLGDRFAIAADGTFTIRGVPTGTYEVLLQWWRDVNPRQRRTVTLEPPLATVELRAGAPRRVELDLAPHLPGRLLGRITHGGAPLAGAYVALATRGGDDGIGGHRTDDDGRFVAPALPAGAYRVCVIAADPDGGDDLRFASDAWTTVDAGRDTHVEFAVERL